jgi:hypothetical protein
MHFGLNLGFKLPWVSGMSKPYRLPQVEEQIVLDELQVQVVGPEDYPRFQSLLRRHHDLQGIRPVGERLYYVAARALEAS